jgi:hypothetical protein
MRAEKGGYSAGDLRRAEEHINAIKDTKIDDPLGGLLPQDPLLFCTGTFKRDGSTSGALDSQAVIIILGEDEGTMVCQILQNDKRSKSVRGGNSVPVSNYLIEPRAVSRTVSSFSHIQL